MTSKFRLGALAVALSLGALVASVATSQSAHSALLSGDVGAMIPMPDGVSLAAEIITPATLTKHPLVVMPSSWGASWSQYHNVAIALEQRGFVVVGYAERGMSLSGGVNDFADALSISDVSNVITWALANTASDPAHIGLFGESYGGGVSLLAAERDPRIKAVASLSGWTDFTNSFVPNGTLSLLTLRSLLGAGGVHLGPDLTALQAALSGDPVAAGNLVKSLGLTRSPITDVAALNKNKTAVMVANGFQDSFFAPHQLVTFYNKLTGPRRLQLAVGDHTQPEINAYFGSPDTGPVGDSLDWLAHYLAGANNAINTAAPIQLQDETTKAATALTTWPAEPASENLDLGAPITSTTESLSDVGDSTSTWSQSITAGTATVADSAAPQLNPLAPYRFTTTSLTGLDPATSDQWRGPTLTSPLTLIGEPTVVLNTSATTSRGTFFLYLYDIDPNGVATLIDAMPQTLTGARQVKTVSIKFDVMDWTLPVGDHLGLVLDTVDRRWVASNTAKSSLTAASTTSAPAYVAMPVSN